MTEAKNGQAKAGRHGEGISANMARENGKTGSNRCPQRQTHRPFVAGPNWTCTPSPRARDSPSVIPTSYRAFGPPLDDLISPQSRH